MNIKAVFFDSGHTLMRPLDGDWFHNDQYFAICARHGIDLARDEAFAAAATEAYEFLDAHHYEVPDVAAELQQFRAYHELVLRALDVSPSHDAQEALVAELAEWTIAEPNFEPFAGTAGLLERIQSSGMPMAIITDAWPSTRAKFRTLGFLDYFQAFVISAEEQCLKPAMGIFEPALEALNVRPEEVLFVDDSPAIIDGAQAHGFRAHLIDLEGRRPQLDALRSLEAVGELLGV